MKWKIPCLCLVAGLSSVAVAGHVTEGEITDALFGTDPGRNCLPYLISVDVSPHDPLQIQTRAAYGASDFPTNGADFLLMSTGDPDAPAEGADIDFGLGGCVDDSSQITLTFDFPDLGGGLSAVQSLQFDFDFFSYEFPEFVGGGFGDYVYAYLDAAPVAVDAACNPTVVPPSGCLLTFDADGRPTNVDAAFLQLCDAIGCDAPSGTPGWDDIFTAVPGDDAGRTGTLVTCTPAGCAIPVTPGLHTLTFMVGDVGDGTYTTVGLFDNLRCESDPICEAPSTQAHCDTNLFGAAHTGGQTAPSTLYELDPATGLAFAIGAIGFNSVGGLDFHPATGLLYGVGRRSVGSEPVLMTVDTLTGAGTEVGPLVNTENSGGHMDLSFTSDGSLFLTARAAGTCVSLFEIDIATGLAIEIGETTTCAPGNALAFDWVDTLRHLDASTMLGQDGIHYTVDPLTGLSSLAGFLDHDGFPDLAGPRPNALEFDPTTGIGYVSLNDGTGGQGPNYLARFDEATGVVTHIGSTVNGLDALAWRVNPAGVPCCRAPAVDADGDGLCDPADSCPAHPNPGGGPAPFGQTVVALDATTFAWAAATDYLVVRGAFVQGGDIRPYPFSLQTSGSGDQFVDGTLPISSGEGLWYLWAPDCPSSSWSSGGAGECALGVGLPGCVAGERDGNLP